MALRYLVTRMRTPAASALRSPAVSRRSPAVRSQPFSAATRQGEREEMNARKKYEFYLAHLESVENDLNCLRVFTERCERMNRYMSLTFKVVLPASGLVIVLKALK